MRLSIRSNSICFHTFVSAIAFLASISGVSQTQLELAAASYTTPPNGPITTNQTATLLENTTGTTFVSTTPALTVTASFSNQQYTGLTGIGMSTGMAFGGAVTSGSSKLVTATAVFNTMSTVGTPSNAMYTSDPNGTAGTGLAVSTNRAFELFTTIEPLYSAGSAINGRFYYGNLTLTFSLPVTDPVLHFSGLGGSTTNGTVHGYSAELELQTASVTASKISGSSELNVSSNKILNNATNLGATCGSGAACGSVKFMGTGITSLVFRVYVRGDNNGSFWSAASIHGGDQFMLGISLNKSTVPLPVTISNFLLEHQNNQVFISWQAEKEKNVAAYEIEHSTDGFKFNSIALLVASQQPSYSWLHQNPSASGNYYRLKATDLDGSVTYSTIRFISLVTPNASTTITLYPNPLIDEFNIRFDERAVGKTAQVQVYNQQGILQRSLKVANAQSTETVSMTGLPSGLYSVKVQANGSETIKLVEKTN